jgi:RNA recognition motif-containing protein
VTRLFVGNIPFTKTEGALAEWFGSQGFRTRAVELIQDRMTNKPRGFGFVELEDDSLAETAVRSLNGKLFAGRALTVGWATPVRESA